MKNLKRFNELYEKAEDATQMVILITDNGERIEKEGYSEEGVGIFDYDGNEYPAAISFNGEVYGSQVDSNDDIFCLDGENIVPGIKMGKSIKTNENLGATSGKKDILIKNIKGIPLDTKNPTILDITTKDVNPINNNDNNNDNIEIEVEETLIEEPKTFNNIKRKMKKRKRIKNFKELTEIGE